jgi:hypothetical protein
MSSYELSRAWFDWCFENPEKINPNHSALYFFCIEHCNRLGWKEKFGLPTTMAKEAIGIKSYNTYKKTLDELVEFGFIKMIEVSKNQYSANIIALSKFDKAVNKALDKAVVKHLIKQSESTGESNCSIIKPLTNNQEPRTIYLANADRDLSFIAKFIRENKPDFLEPYIDCWNMFAEKFGKQKIIKLTKSREQKLKARLKDETFIFPDILNKAHKQLFITENNWFTFDWVLQNETNYLKVLEGNYMSKPKQETTTTLNRYKQ